MIQQHHPQDRAAPHEGAVDRGIVALAGVRAARGELCRASGLLRRAIHVAAMQGVSPEQLATATGTSVDHIQRIATESKDPAAANTQADRDGRGDRS